MYATIAIAYSSNPGTTCSFWNIALGVLSILAVLGGVYLGYYLSHRKEKKAYEQLIRNLKESLLIELESNLYQIKQKRNIIIQIIQSLNENRILPGECVRFITTGYHKHISEIYSHLKIKERNSIHVIYEYMNIIDKSLFSFEENIKFELVRQYIPEQGVFNNFIKRFYDISNTLDKLEELIKKHLGGKPVDVFNVDKLKTSNIPEQ